MNSEWWRLLPNAITSARLVLAAAMLALLEVLGRTPLTERGALGWWVSIMFVTAALSDVLDGWLARRWNVVTPYGRVMDPFVDKVLVLGTFIFLASSGLSTGAPELHITGSGVAAWMVVVMVARELLVTSLRGVMEGMGKPFPADRFGKAKMLMQCIAIPWCVFAASETWLPQTDWCRIGHPIVLWSAVVLTVLSGIPALLRAGSLLAGPGSPKKSDSNS
ncbi:MAG: CDP-diacylglycerol--glycerol-3-phosphate 3-phosphatidyltransferase [Planctomycetes bacterium]|nr:CDP-diacylglycerol--glycerol-3-phosphate 3-phosphatidyltransferase [Planctomycetota bacterium]